MAFDKKKFLQRFIEEARDHIKRLNEGLLILEKNSGDTDTLDAIFRSAHTIKGSSRMMKLLPITELAHRIENTLDALRQNKIQLSTELSDLFFQGIDLITDMLEKAGTGEELQEAPKEICESFDLAAQGTIAQQPRVQKQIKSPQKPKVEDKSKSDEKPDKHLPSKTAESIRVSEAKLDGLIKLIGEIMSNQQAMKRRVFDINNVEKTLKMHMDLMAFLSQEKQLSHADKDKLVKTANFLNEKITKFSASLKEDANLAELLTTELQDQSLKMRMMPISTLFDTFHRTARDLARSLHKKVDLTVTGGETELDKKIIEKIGDPLIHMIRNSIDHGIETVEDRLGKGKPETGLIKLSAGYESGSVMIKLSDDGAGISLERIKEKAVSKRIVLKEEIDLLPKSEILNLIFHPGLSTAEMITDVSGRGVGMDVVKQNISDELKGSIHIKTQKDKGTTFSITLPLTMAIMHVLVVRVSEMSFAVPANYISEIIRIPEDDIIDVVDKKAIRLREQIIPVIRLNDILSIKESEPTDKKGCLTLIVSLGEESMGIIVDSLLKEEHRAIKPLPAHLKDNPWISGVTISGGNKIDSILHIPKIIKSAKEVNIRKPVIKTEEIDKQQINILVVDDSISTREIEKSILESYGYHVTLAGNGIEALENAEKFKYDLIVTDIEMPQMDGFSLTERLKKNEAYKNTPIILVSSLDKDEDKRKGLRVGADAYIVKGDFDQTNLIDAIQNLVG